MNRTRKATAWSAAALFLAVTVTTALAAPAAAAGPAPYGCRTPQGTYLSVQHTWDTVPTVRLGYRNTFAAGPGSKAALVAINGSGSGTTASTYAKREGARVTVRLFATVRDWCQFSVPLRTKA